MVRSSRLGIPLNLTLAATVAAVFAGTYSGSVLASDVPVTGIAIALLVQEAVLVQWLSRGANIEFEERLLGYRASNSSRAKFLLLPFGVLLLFGIVLFLLSDRPLDASGGVRILAVSMILVLCIDPLLGLIGKGPIALIGAGLAYVVVLNAGVSGHEHTAAWLSGYLPPIAGDGIVVGVLAYLVLSCRWTYYRLFCYEEMDEWSRAVADTLLPFTFLALGAMPETLAFLATLYVGN